MEKGSFSILLTLFIVVMALILPRVAFGEPRADRIQIRCTEQDQQNSSNYVTNFVAAADDIRQELETQDYGLENSGQGPDTVYALAQCYGDLSSTDCTLCYLGARNSLSECFPSNGATVFLDGCFMRTANFSFYQEYTGPEDRAICGNSTRKDSAFQETARRAVSQAASAATNNNGYARAEMRVPDASNESAYALANCWKTLDANSCRACLENASTSILGCLPWSEGRVLNTGCFMRYSDTNFLNPMRGNGSSKGTPTGVIAAVVSSAVVGVIAAIVVAYIWHHRRTEKRRKGYYDAKKWAKTLTDSSLNFKYSTLEKATNGFDEANKLGQGGSGIVYKGVLPDGREIAIKRLFSNNVHRPAEFYNEVNIISSIEHKNLVRLLGCSLSGRESLLVYEFLPNKSLDCFIFDSDEGKVLNWEKRLAIIMGIAEGLVYLHENTKMRIIHRDIKASNILMDARLRAKIADFGLVRAFQEDKSHISTGVAGTLGYIAPEYLTHGQLTEKADVYSYGVLVLEIVTGRQNNKSKSSEYLESLVITTWKHFQKGTAEELIDSNLLLHDLHDTSFKNEILRVIHVGLLCTQEMPSLRPSMSEALQILTKKDEDLPPPTNPPYIDETAIEFNVMSGNSSVPFFSSSFGSVASITKSSSNGR